MGMEFWGFLCFLGCDFSFFGGCFEFSKLGSNITFWSSLVAIHLLIRKLLSVCICLEESLSRSDGRPGIMEALERKRAEFMVVFPTNEHWQ